MHDEDSITRQDIGIVLGKIVQFAKWVTLGAGIIALGIWLFG